jgi:uncharacterized protein DUF6529
VGFGLFALTLPIAVHCLIAYGVQLTSMRVAVHSLVGCFFLWCLRRKGAAGADQAASRMGAAGGGRHTGGRRRRSLCTSALWYYNGYQLPHI